MKNYKIFVIDGYGSSGFRKRVLTKEQHDTLLDLGYKYEDFFNQYQKYYSNDTDVYCGLKIYIPLDKKYIYYYSGGRFETLAELNEDTYKGVLKKLREDLREMKKVGITK